MTNEENASRPFVIQDCFIETAFEQRFQAILHRAWKQRSWHTIAAVPGSGKSSGINDFVLQSGAFKDSAGRTSLPILAVRAPKNDVKDSRLVVAFSACFGTVPRMAANIRRNWLVEAAILSEVQCIIIDDAHDLNDYQLAFIKELTDNLSAQPYQQKVGLCLVVAHTGKIMPFKEIFARPEIIWRQFRRRFDAELPFCSILGHTVQEVREILLSFEEMYKPQLPDLQLCQWSDSIYSWLVNPILDPELTGRVTMHHLTQLVVTALRRSYNIGATDVDASTLQSVADLMILRRDEVIAVDGSHPNDDLPEFEIG